MDCEALPGPLPEKGMQQGEQQRHGHHASPQRRAAAMLDDQIAAEEDLLDHRRAEDRIESGQCWQLRLPRDETKQMFAAGSRSKSEKDGEESDHESARQDR